jgi:hypothetical protein
MHVVAAKNEKAANALDLRHGAKRPGWRGDRGSNDGIVRIVGCQHDRGIGRCLHVLQYIR